MPYMDLDDEKEPVKKEEKDHTEHVHHEPKPKDETLIMVKGIIAAMSKRKMIDVQLSPEWKELRKLLKLD